MKCIDNLVEGLNKEIYRVFRDYEGISWDEAKQDLEKCKNKAYFDGVMEGIKIAVEAIEKANREIDKKLKNL